MDEKWNEDARTGTANYIIVRGGGRGRIEKEKLIVGAVEPFHGQRVKHMVEGVKKNVEPSETRQEGKKNLYEWFPL